MRSAQRQARRTTENGFTLFEVLVSLGIAMLLVAGIVRAFGSAWLQASSTAELASGSALARSLLAERRTQPNANLPLRDGTTSGYHWQVTTEPLHLVPPPAPAPSATDAAQPTAPSGPANALHPLLLNRIIVEVSGPSGRKLRLESLVAEPEAH